MSEAKRKYTLYQKSTTRNIILTDNNPKDSPEEVKNKLIKLMASKKICVIQTQDDLFVFRPNDFSGILVSAKGEFEERRNDVHESDDIEMDSDDFLDQLANADNIEESDDESDSTDYENDLVFKKPDDKVVKDTDADI